MQMGLIICTISCALSALSKSIYMFDFAQVIEAISRATVMLTMQLWIAGISNKENLAARLSWYTILIAVSPILAPSVGGVIAESASWQYCFIVLGVLSLAMLAGISIFRIQEKTEQQELPTNRPKFSPQGDTMGIPPSDFTFTAAGAEFLVRMDGMVRRWIPCYLLLPVCR